jgi:hypothetical protein
LNFGARFAFAINDFFAIVPPTCYFLNGMPR